MTQKRTYDFIARWRITFQKMRHFEYWPTFLIYIPLAPKLLSLFIRSGSIFAYKDTNPGFEFKSGLRESKIDILNKIPSKWLPKTHFLHIEDKENWSDEIRKFQPFPLICKPELGERGKGVALIKTEQELMDYIAFADQNIIVQEYIDYALEMGVFYIRIPGESKGRITSVVRKECMQITGDGKSSVRELLQNELRYLIQLHNRTKDWDLDFDEVLEAGKVRLLEPIANHSRGTRFVDDRESVSEDMLEMIDEIAKSIDGFYYGRFDLKISSIEAFQKRKGIKVIELNGIWSEPAHIYDPVNSISNNYKTIWEHYKYAYKIASLNRKRINLSIPEFES